MLVRIYGTTLFCNNREHNPLCTHYCFLQSDTMNSPEKNQYIQILQLIRPFHKERLVDLTRRDKNKRQSEFYEKE